MGIILDADTENVIGFSRLFRNSIWWNIAIFFNWL